MKLPKLNTETSDLQHPKLRVSSSMFDDYGGRADSLEKIVLSTSLVTK